MVGLCQRMDVGPRTVRVFEVSLRGLLFTSPMERNPKIFIAEAVEQAISLLLLKISRLVTPR